MSDIFFQQPILNSPYLCPTRHWETDGSGQPTGKQIPRRRLADFITPIPKPRKNPMQELALDVDKTLSSEQQKYAHSRLINELRHEVALWRALPESKWKVTAETARLLKHWRHHEFADIRPFFCQIEALETVIWLHEVAPDSGKKGQYFLEHLKQTHLEANPGLLRLALKLATGAGKTTVMAMLIAWQTINAVRHRRSTKFTKGFLIVAPGITIKDRLRVLQPNDPDSYYASRELVPRDLLPELNKARIVITNYHAFKRRETLAVSKGTRRLLQGRFGSPLESQESEGQMLQRVIPSLSGLKNILVINDEAHHCYREKAAEVKEKLSAEDKAAAEENNQAARLWISGLEAVQRLCGLQQVIDLSATPFFLAGSGYIEGTLFPWTMSDFSLMDAIECGIVKLPRVPVADNIPSAQMPIYRDLWQHIGKKMPKKARSKSNSLDPLSLPQELQTALEVLYGHYEKTFALWQQAGIRVPPCFIVVCNNTATSKLIYDYISGFTRDDGSVHLGALPLLRNVDDNGQPLARPNTLLIDSQQLESGEALSENFRQIAADEIERFRRDIIRRTGDSARAESLSEADLLREVMNTVGKPGQLGETIRCVVSVSMLTEGWDANTVTHILGVRAFGTQLLCEQVIGRALRRQSYALDENGLLSAEYADIFGIPFDFAAKPTLAPPQPPREVVTVKAIRPDRDHLHIHFPRVLGYRQDWTDAPLCAEFSEEHRLYLTPEQVGPTITLNSAIIGETLELEAKEPKDVRPATLLMRLTRQLMLHCREQGAELPLHRYGELKRITKQWLETCLICQGENVFPAQLLYPALAQLACEKIRQGIVQPSEGKAQPHKKALLDPYNPSGSSEHVHFQTSRENRWFTIGPPPKNPVNWVICDSDWEGEFCRVLEAHPHVVAYTKNHNLGLEVPYRMGGQNRVYLPDFILKVDDGHGEDDLLNLIIEIKGYRRIDADFKKNAITHDWLPAVNALNTFGRWAFAEFTNVWDFNKDLSDCLQKELNNVLRENQKSTSGGF